MPSKTVVISSRDLLARLSGASADPCVLDQTLTFLGYAGQTLTPEMVGRIGEAIEEVEKVARPLASVSTFAADEVPLELEGRDIQDHLAGACQVVLVAATLGAGVDAELRRLKVCDPVGQVLFDAAASAYIERVMDVLEADIRNQAQQEGLYCGWRFSPGYGDFPLSVQPRLLAVLDASRRLGITLSESYLMVPTKSVTAIIGKHPTPQEGLAKTCSICSLSRFCSMRSRGVTCARKRGQ